MGCLVNKSRSSVGKTSALPIVLLLQPYDPSFSDSSIFDFFVSNSDLEALLSLHLFSQPFLHTDSVSFLTWHLQLRWPVHQPQEQA